MTDTHTHTPLKHRLYITHTSTPLNMLLKIDVFMNVMTDRENERGLKNDSSEHTHAFLQV